MDGSLLQWLFAGVAAGLAGLAGWVWKIKETGDENAKHTGEKIEATGAILTGLMATVQALSKALDVQRQSFERDVANLQRQLDNDKEGRHALVEVRENVATLMATVQAIRDELSRIRSS